MKRNLWVTVCLVGLLPATQAWSQQQQTERRQTTQQDQTQQQNPRTQQRQQTEQQTEARRARRSGTEQAHAEGGLEQSLAILLALGNKAEIELGQLASEKAQNEDVREFAEKMVEEHTQFLGKLKQVNPQIPDAEGTQLRSAQTTDRAGQQDRAGQRGTAQTPQRNGVAQAGGATPREGEVARTGFDRNTSSAQNQSGLVAVLKDAAQQKLEMSKEELSKYEGQDFDMGYLSSQVHAHVGMLAHLKAMKGKGDSNFNELVDQGITTTSQHLEQAKKLAKRLEDKEYNAQGNQQPNRQNQQRGNQQN